MEKSAEAFRTISEVADILQTPAHVLRFWESRFPQIKPVKRAGGRRYYRPSDVALLTGIRRLLHDDGMTIRGVQKILREQGVRRVAEMGRQDEAAFIELAEDSFVAEVHPFPQRGPAPTRDTTQDAGWTFSPASEDEEDASVTEEEFFARSGTEDIVEDGPPPPLGLADAALARERAQRLREAPENQPALPFLILRLLALEPGTLPSAVLDDMHDRLSTLRRRMDER
ncbi:MerR family transcriptional regulator [Falsirhodobacter deserti]|uniref:MerR family transcriptional regulator n=1 Tax=Falsirhodobacter deserti TaxID=1365611 RepID=UPI001F4D5781|nr:MerR family transcriptional regulator [Falsirhodobacter deserti]